MRRLACTSRRISGSSSTTRRRTAHDGLGPGYRAAPMASQGERTRRLLATGLQWAWGKATFLGAIQAGQPAARRFGAFGEGSFIAFPVTALYNERYIRIGDRTRIGPHV